MIRQAIADARAAGASLAAACREVGLSVRTLQRWAAAPTRDDQRAGPRRRPPNALTPAERAAVRRVVNAPAHRDLSPKQIVPRLADAGVYVASESTIYRLLRADGQLAHRGRARPPQRRVRPAHVATAPNEVWSWDITYLPTTVRGAFLYLYLVMDIWSRKVVAWAVHAEERAEHAAALLDATCTALGLDRGRLVLHSDNGGPMKGATMLATLQRLGVVPSFSRPGVSDDNPYSEALFRTLKYTPAYPAQPFADLAAARAWVARFVAWYNDAHRHSAIRFVTPSERHDGRERAILAQRRAVYERARRAHPARWTGRTRNWEPVARVALTPEREEQTSPRRKERPAA